jgi:hypothetical protein
MERAWQTRLLRELVGDPVTMSRDCGVSGNDFQVAQFAAEWRTTTVRGIAEGMYASCDFSAMPILADALQDAGCDNADVFAHCRGSDPHVRGCWCVDLILGKE